MKLGTLIALSAALLAIAVPSFAQGRGGFGRGGGNIIAMPEVQKELKLDDAQQDLVKQLSMEMQQKRQALFQGLQGGGNRQEAMQKFRELQQEQDKKVGEILSRDQMARYKQLHLQRTGIRALDQKEVADQLKLTSDQRAQVVAAINGEREAMQAAFQSAQGGDREAARAKFQEIRQSTDAKLNAVLTDAQKRQFDQMKGAAFQFPQRGPGQGARNGGPRRQSGNAAA